MDMRWTFGGQQKFNGEKFKKFPIVKHNRTRYKMIKYTWIINCLQTKVVLDYLI
jgi:hypothetical protein